MHTCVFVIADLHPYFRIPLEMSTVRLHDKDFDIYISSDQIQARIKELATSILNDYKHKSLVLLGILNGSYRVISDLSKFLDILCEIEFAKVSSYDGLESSGVMRTFFLPSEKLEGKDVLIVEDIIDTGLTLDNLVINLNSFDVKSLEVVSLLFKPASYQGSKSIKYVGFEIPNDFVVGFGLDYDGLGRNLNDIYKLSNSKDMLNIVLFGPPGAGKGTQSELLIKKYDLVHLSTGDIFRYNIKNETDLGKMAQEYMDKGELVPDEVTIRMLSAEVEKNKEARGFIFDGFPRTPDQAIALRNLLESMDQSISMMIALEVDDEELISRLLERGKTSGRADDANREVISNRISVYNKQTAPVAEFYRKQNKYRGVNGVGTIEEIHQRISQIIEEH